MFGSFLIEVTMSNVIYSHFNDKKETSAIDAEVGLICIDMMAIRDLCHKKKLDTVTNLIDIAIMELVRSLAQNIEDKN